MIFPAIVFLYLNFDFLLESVWSYCVMILDMMHYPLKKKMEVLRNGATDAFVIGSDILCIFR